MGKLVAVDEEGRPSFQGVLRFRLLHHQAAHTLVFVGVRRATPGWPRSHRNARWTNGEPCSRRVLKGAHLLDREPLPGTPEQIEKAVRALHLEGVVAKRRTSRYEPGKRSRSWVKVKFNRRQAFVVGGFTPNAGGFESLLVGYYAGRTLIIVASKVRAGLTPHVRAELFARNSRHSCSRSARLRTSQSKTGHWGEGIPAEDMIVLRWVKPMIVAEVSFVEWTRDGLLRHPEFLEVRNDKSPKRSVVRTVSERQQRATFVAI